MKRFVVPVCAGLLMLLAPLAHAQVGIVTGTGVGNGANSLQTTNSSIGSGISSGATSLTTTGSAPNSGVIGQYSNLILTVINTYLVPLLFTIAFIVFLYGVFQYFILGGADEEKRKSGREFILWGIIGFAVMISLWGLVNVLVGSVGLGGGTHPAYPTL